MRSVVARNTFVFWTLLIATTLGDERRDPTLPSSSIQQRLAKSTKPESPAPPLAFKVKAVILSDDDHGLALVQVGDRTLRVPLNRSQPTELMIGETRHIVKSFSRSSVVLEAVAPSSPSTLLSP